ncbi:hypothetical protein [Kitasatospora sp. NPDC088548]|uniref:hypothetical protein n=1 Tax=Kitasatospora sp. NPDC088548 TaxID=3364075 RepID=UPI00382308F0
MTTAWALRPAEPLSEGAYQAGLDAMFAEVDRTFQAEQPAEAPSQLLDDPNSTGWVVPSTARATTTAGLRVITARVDPLDDAALAEITAQAAALIADRDRLGSR